jgi:hypothetical protein
MYIDEAEQSFGRDISDVLAGWLLKFLWLYLAGI